MRLLSDNTDPNLPAGSAWGVTCRPSGMFVLFYHTVEVASLNRNKINVSLEDLRKLVVRKQLLNGNGKAVADKERILSTVRKLAYVQWDPVTVIAPSHVISLWSRIGSFRLSDLENLLWNDRKIFLHWTPIAAIVMSEDYPIFKSLMSRYPESLEGSWRSHMVSARKFMSENSDLRLKILRELRKGPLQANQFEEHRKGSKSEDGWSPSSKVTRMLFHMHMSGEVMVVSHNGNQNVWGLTEDFIPEDQEMEALSPAEYEREASRRAILAMGAATAREINYYFVRGRYSNLKNTLKELHEDSRIQQINVTGIAGKEDRYIHSDDIPLLESIRSDEWVPKVSLISPCDNLICGRDRTRRVFGFDYVHEQFFPKEKRKYGTYVMPILFGERIIGRIDPKLDKRKRKLLINSVHAEPDAPGGSDVAGELSDSIRKLAVFLGADEIEYTEKVPEHWKRGLTSL